MDSMGSVHVTGQIGRGRDDLSVLEFLVDTGSFYTALSPEVREQLHLAAGIPAQTILADRRIVDTEVTLAHLKLNGREGVIPVEVMEGIPQPLLGASALEALGMKVNPVSGELEIVWPFSAPPTMTRFRWLP